MPAEPGIVLATHGDMATGLVSAVEVIAGPQEGCEAVSLSQESSPEGFGELLAAGIERADAGAGVLVLADLPGATPFNVAARLARDRDDVEVVTGVSLPMLLEVLLGRAGVSVGDLAEAAVRAATAGVVRWTSDTGGSTCR